jgi:hypothetical protein
MTFNNGAPTTYDEWCDLGYDITPCVDKRPIVQGWVDKKVVKKIWEHNKYTAHQIGLKLKGKTDVDIDCHVAKKFIEVYFKSCGAIYGRESNPRSHYLFDGETPYKKYTMPKELEHYMKDYPHGVTLLEIRSGRDKQSIVPGSKINGEDVVWDKFASINSYPGNLEEDISIIVLSTALSILYAPTGARDDYCTAIAGVLSQHTDWSEDNINNFIYNLAVRSGDDEANKRMAKGTNAKNPKTKNLGFPKLAEILNCTVKTVASLFEWVGVKDSGSCFTALKVYESEPKYWKLKYKDTWITIMDSAMLLSYTKLSILILENCYEVAPVVAPKDWKGIIADLLKDVEKVEVPIDASYYQSIGLNIIDMLSRHVVDDDKDNVFGGLSNWGVWLNKKNMCLYTKLENITTNLNQKRISFERRKLIEHMQSNMGAEHCKVNVRGKDIRVWKFPEDILNQRNRQTAGLAEHVEKKHTEANEKVKNAF